MPATDLFPQFPLTFTAPYDTAFAITKSDENDLAYVTRGIYVGGNGNVAVVTPKGNTVTFTGATAGTILPIRAKQVLSTGTTATNLVGLV